ncbi:MAG: ECF-type sigma factor [Planctomycetota bacterium]
MPTEPLTTQILNRFAAGDRSLEADLVEGITRELHVLAEAQLARAAGARTLQPTALVHEAWLKIAGADDVAFEARRQFYRFAGKLMRNILIDRARAARNTRREAELSLSELGLSAPEEQSLVDALDLEDAVARLEEREEELARVAELRLYCGLEHAETAAVLDCSVRTVERRWRFARAWLIGELQGGGENA